jgi:hypothetical protein
MVSRKLVKPIKNQFLRGMGMKVRRGQTSHEKYFELLNLPQHISDDKSVLMSDFHFQGNVRPSTFSDGFSTDFSHQTPPATSTHRPFSKETPSSSSNKEKIREKTIQKLLASSHIKRHKFIQQFRTSQNNVEDRYSLIKNLMTDLETDNDSDLEYGRNCLLEYLTNQLENDSSLRYDISGYNELYCSIEDAINEELFHFQLHSEDSKDTGVSEYQNNGKCNEMDGVYETETDFEDGMDEYLAEQGSSQTEDVLCPCCW